MTDLYPDLPIPPTGLAATALRFAQRIEPAPIFNHSLRSYLFGRAVGQRQGLRAAHDYDDELLFLGCVLHDVGLSDEGNGRQTFDLDGADLAAEFLGREGVAPDRVEIVWNAIALHLTPHIARRKRPEIALVSTGAGVDLGAGPEALPDGYAEQVHAVLPRLHAAPVIRDAIVEQALRDPGKAPPLSLAGELVRQRTAAAWPTWEQLTQSPGWHDYDGYEA
ncbi:HD domain-containing protein [Micromonosporaceae bacterium B7E4]